LHVVGGWVRIVYTQHIILFIIIYTYIVIAAYIVPVQQPVCAFGLGQYHIFRVDGTFRFMEKGCAFCCSTYTLSIVISGIIIYILLWCWWWWPATREIRFTPVVLFHNNMYNILLYIIYVCVCAVVYPLTDCSVAPLQTTTSVAKISMCHDSIL